MTEEDKERIAILFTGPSLLAGMIGSVWAWILARGHDATAWLIQHNILVPADQAVIKILDAGLDVARCALIAAIIVLIIWGSIAAARKKRANLA